MPRNKRSREEGPNLNERTPLKEGLSPTKMQKRDLSDDVDLDSQSTDSLRASSANSQPITLNGLSDASLFHNLEGSSASTSTPINSNDDEASASSNSDNQDPMSVDSDIITQCAEKRDEVKTQLDEYATLAEERYKKIKVLLEMLGPQGFPETSIEATYSSFEVMIKPLIEEISQLSDQYHQTTTQEIEAYQRQLAQTSPAININESVREDAEETIENLGTSLKTVLAVLNTMKLPRHQKSIKKELRRKLSESLTNANIQTSATDDEALLTALLGEQTAKKLLEEAGSETSSCASSTFSQN